jgi:hypothetical protein
MNMKNEEPSMAIVRFNNLIENLKYKKEKYPDIPENIIRLDSSNVV